MRPSTDVREPAVSGMFYPRDAESLREDVKEMLSRPERMNLPGAIRGIIAPHAGYMYSGPTAAHAYAQLQGSSYEVVVIVSPSHRDYFDGVSVYPGTAYRTPLGSVPIHAELREILVRTCSAVTASEAGHRDEHAIEVQLPFLQVVLPPFALLPLVIGHQSRTHCLQLGRALATILRDRNALLISSTDLSHYHPASLARRLDSIVIDDIRRFDYEQLMTDLEMEKAEACGGGPTVAVMAALHHLQVRQMEVLHQCNSGDVTGDTRSVVGYVSAAAFAEQGTV